MEMMKCFVVDLTLWLLEFYFAEVGFTSTRSVIVLLTVQDFLMMNITAISGVTLTGVTYLD